MLNVTVDSSGERGLLGVALHPDFASNGFIYVYYTSTETSTHNRVSRFTATGNVAGSELKLVELPTLSGATNHNGGAMHFGLDGKLYVAVGDNANSANSPNLNSVLGKMLRFNDDGTIPTRQPVLCTTQTWSEPARSGRTACAIRSRSPCSPVPAASTSTTSGKTPGKKSIWARLAPTTAGRLQRGRTT